MGTGRFIENQTAAPWQNDKILNECKTFSTFTMLLLSIYTFGIYPALYTRQMSLVLNNNNPKAIPIWISNTALALALPSLIVFIITYLGLITDYEQALRIIENETAAAINAYASIIQYLFIIAWSIITSKTMNAYFDFPRKSNEHYSLFWSFFFGPFYINWKFNKLNQKTTNFNKKYSIALYFSILFINYALWYFLLNIATPTIGDKLYHQNLSFTLYSKFVLNIANIIRDNYLFILLGYSFILIVQKNKDLILFNTLKTLGILSSLLLFAFAVDLFLQVIELWGLPKFIEKITFLFNHYFHL